jgi:hypothetical protein
MKSSVGHLVYNTFLDCAEVALCTEEASQLQSSEFHFSEVFHMEHDENEVPVLEMLSLRRYNAVQSLLPYICNADFTGVAGQQFFLPGLSFGKAFTSAASSFPLLLQNPARLAMSPLVQQGRSIMIIFSTIYTAP